MFLSIYNNRSGEEFIRRVAPNEDTCDLRAMVRKWADKEFSEYNVELSFSEPGAHIPNGCADWQAELRYTKESGAGCWTSEPFYLTLSE